MNYFCVKKILVFFTFCATCFVFASLSAAATMPYGKIEDYKAELEIGRNKEIVVSENIVHRVKAGENREVVRIIPRIVEKDGQRATIKISKPVMRDSSGNKVDFKMKKQREEYRISFLNNSGEVETYELDYKVKNAFLFDNNTQTLLVDWLGLFEANDIKQTKLALKMPVNVSQNEIESQCLSGGEVKGDCVSSRYEYDGQDMVTGIVFIDDSLSAGRSIEYSVILPEHIFPNLTYADSILLFIRAKWLYVVGVMFILLIVYKISKRKKIL